MIQRIRRRIARLLAATLTVLSLGRLEVDADGTIGRRRAARTPIEASARPDEPPPP